MERLNSQKRSLSLERRARRAAAISLVLQIISVILVSMMFTASMVDDETEVPLEGLSREEQMLLGAEQAGAGCGMAFFSALGLWLALLSRRFARKWLVDSHQLLSQDEASNRKILEDCRTEGRPFALYLRGFEEEAKRSEAISAVPVRKSQRKLQGLLKMTRWAEYEVVNELTKRGLTVFCIANPESSYHLGGAYRLAARGTPWIREIEEMASDANLVILYVTGKSAGLLTEIKALKQLGLRSRTVGVESWSLEGAGASPIGDLPLTIRAPLMLSNTPVFSRRRFRRNLVEAVEGALGGSRLEPSAARADSLRERAHKRMLRFVVSWRERLKSWTPRRLSWAGAILVLTLFLAGIGYGIFDERPKIVREPAVAKPSLEEAIGFAHRLEATVSTGESAEVSQLIAWETMAKLSLAGQRSREAFVQAFARGLAQSSLIETLASAVAAGGELTLLRSFEQENEVWVAFRLVTEEDFEHVYLRVHRLDETIMATGIRTLSAGYLHERIKILFNYANKSDVKSKNIHSAFSRSTELLGRGDFQQARGAVGRLIEIEPREKFFNLVAIQIAVGVGDLELLASSVRRLKLYYPQDSSTAYMAYLYLSQIGELAEALKELDILESLATDDPYFDILRAHTLGAQGDFHQALLLAESARERDPSLSEAHVLAYKANVRLGRSAEGEQARAETIRLFGFDPAV